MSEDSADTNGLAIASLFIGIIWLFGAGSVAAIWLGYRALREIDSSGGEQGGRGIALAGIIIGVVGILSLGFLIAFVLYSASHHGSQ